MKGSIVTQCTQVLIENGIENKDKNKPKYMSYDEKIKKKNNKK